MALASSRSYKNYQRNQRKIVTETTFNKGMAYTDNPLLDGQVRLLVNYIQKDFGDTLRPRGAWVQAEGPVQLSTAMGAPYIHHIGAGLVTNTVTNAVTLMRYALVVNRDELEYAHIPGCRVIVEEEIPQHEWVSGTQPTRFHVSEFIGDVVDGPLRIRQTEPAKITYIHDLYLGNQTPDGLAATINGNTYVLTEQGLARLDLYVDHVGNYTHEFNLVVANTPTPMQAVNYGYNMLLDSPYHFENETGLIFQPLGIIPYDPVTEEIMLKAQVGQDVRFRLYYKYNEAESYNVQWEIQDINQQGAPTVLAHLTNSADYASGADIYVDASPQFKQFSIICRVYLTTDNVNPIREVVLASYRLSDDKTSDQDSMTYDLMTAKGICEWSSQMVYWGVTGAEMSIFLSNSGDPTYVPFPNNNIDFNERVFKCFPYKEQLFVICEHTLYLVDFNEDFSGYTKKAIQNNLEIREEDAYAAVPMRNMVYFKAGDYYFMVVPNPKNILGELQMAPVTTPITQFLDDFKNQVYRILADVYPLTDFIKTGKDTLLNAMRLADYYVCADGNRIRTTYKILFDVPDHPVWVDFQLVYDTIFRTWHIEVRQTNNHRMQIFHPLATNYAQFLNLYNDGQVAYLQRLSIDELQAEDNFVITPDTVRQLDNVQMLDTGKRALDPEMKKRFRHVVFEINNLSHEDLEFNHLFMIDDETRSDLFVYEIEHETDPDASNYGQIYVVRNFEAPEVLAGEVSLVYVDEREPDKLYGITKLNSWVLSSSAFPDRTVQKVYVDVSGKGYYPRFKLITQNSKRFELNHVSWSYRDMGAR